VTDLRSDITEIARNIWETLFSLPLDQPDADGVLPRDIPQVTGCVQIDGAWNGAVLFQCPDELANKLAAELFRPVTTASPEEVRDAIGELTNMFAGNIKALLPEPSRISLPAVALGADYDLQVIGTRVVAAVAFECGGFSLLVTLLQA
jgi:chemotaxis protein CheX